MGKVAGRLLFVCNRQRQPRLAHAAWPYNRHQGYGRICQPCAEQFDLSHTPHQRCGWARQRWNTDMSFGRR